MQQRATVPVPNPAPAHTTPQATPQTTPQSPPGRAATTPRDAYRFSIQVGTGYTDQDPNGHINNTAYYRFTDTVVALYRQHLGLEAPERTMVTVENSARYLKETHFPETLTVGIRIERVGRSSVLYRIGMFHTDDDQPAVELTSTQVWIDTTTRRPTPIDGEMRGRAEAELPTG